MASTEAGRGAQFLGLEEFQRVQTRRHVPRVDFEELTVAVIKRPRLRVLDVQGPDHGAVINQRDGQGTAGPGGSFQVVRVRRRIGTQVALPGRGDKPGDAVVRFAGEQLATGRLHRHPLGQERDQSAVGPVQEANLDEVKPEQVLHVPDDVVFQEVGPLLDPHLAQFLGGEVGQLVARLVNGGDLLGLQGLVGDVAGQGDQVGQLVGFVEDRRGGEAEITVGVDPEFGADRPARTHGVDERAG